MRTYIILILLLLLTGCVSSGYNAGNADLMRSMYLLNYSAQMLAPARNGYPMYGIYPGGSFMYTPAGGDQTGVICNTYGTMTNCTGY